MSITNAINIMHYFAQQDPQGSRLLFILTSFRDVVLREQAARDQQTLSDQAQARKFAQSQMIKVSEANDRMGNLFQGSSGYAPEKPAAPPVANPIINRNNSTTSISPTSAAYKTNFQRISSYHNDTLSSTANGPDSMISRNNSLDAFFDLARVSSYPNSTGSGHDSDSLADAEIDFESLWQWSNSNGLTGLTPGLGSGMGLTPASVMGVQDPVQASGIDVKGISDSSVPLFGMTSGESGGS
jgi:hypothetical protein